MRRSLLSPVPVAALAGVSLVLAGCGASAASPTASTGASGPMIEIVAQGIEFDPSRLELPADTRLRLRFRNADRGVRHGLLVATRTSGVPPRELGELPPVEGPAVREFDLEPLAPGPYLFSCPVHPTMQVEVDVE